MKETWKPIPEYNGVYEVSNLGKVRKRCKNGKIIILKPRLNYKGYGRVALINHYKRKEFCVHRLVAKCFIENKYHKPQVNHIDGNKTNNNVNNLEWVTAKENCIHRSKLYRNNVI